MRPCTLPGSGGANATANLSADAILDIPVTRQSDLLHWLALFHPLITAPVSISLWAARSVRTSKRNSSKSGLRPESGDRGAAVKMEKHGTPTGRIRRSASPPGSPAPRFLGPDPGPRHGASMWTAHQRLQANIPLTDIQAPAGLAAGTAVPITARADWLVRAYLHPRRRDLQFHAAGEQRAGGGRPEMGKAMSPRALPRTGRLELMPRASTTRLRLSSGQARVTRIHNLTLFPDQDGWIENASPQRMIRTARGYELRIASAAAIRSKSGPLTGLIVAEPGLAKGVAAAVVEVPVESAAALVDEILEQPALSQFADLGLLAALGLAFLGGVILNLMPCVFPVVSIKVLGFVEQARGHPARLRTHGLAFAAGVLVSFWVVAGILLALRAQGEALGWGYQLQSPPVVAALALLFFVLALNLSGLFQVGMSLQSLAGKLRLRNDYADSAFWPAGDAGCHAVTVPFGGGAWLCADAAAIVHRFSASRWACQSYLLLCLVA